MADLEWVAIQCDCKSPNHSIRFCFDPDDGELYLDVQLVLYHSVFKRIWLALLYVLGKAGTRSHWDCVLLTESAAQVAELCGKVDKFKQEWGQEKGEGHGGT